MQSINRLLINLCTDNLEESKNFYCQLFDFQPAFESDWFIQLVSAEKNLELGIIQKDHELVPEDFRYSPQGIYLTMVLGDVEKTFSLAKEKGLNIIQEPADTFYGQRRMLLRAPEGTLIDVSSLI
ncbi:MAG: VOC family protein [Bacteroidota bacterium]